MIKNSDRVKCRECGQQLSAQEEQCPTCGSTNQKIDALIEDGIAIRDQVSTVMTVTSTSISLPSGTSASYAIPITASFLLTPSGEREISLSKILADKDPLLKDIQNELPKEVHSLLEEGKESTYLKKGGNFYYLNKCTVIGSSIGGDVNTENLTFMNCWDGIKDSIDIESLKFELQKIIKELGRLANSDAEYEMLAEVGKALSELNKANAPGMLKNLKKGGQWLITLAKETGTELLAKVIAESLRA